MGPKLSLKEECVKGPLHEAGGAPCTCTQQLPFLKGKSPAQTEQCTQPSAALRSPMGHTQGELP